MQTLRSQSGQAGGCREDRCSSQLHLAKGGPELKRREESGQERPEAPGMGRWRCSSCPYLNNSCAFERVLVPPNGDEKSFHRSISFSFTYQKLNRVELWAHFHLVQHLKTSMFNETRQHHVVKHMPLGQGSAKFGGRMPKTPTSLRHWCARSGCEGPDPCCSSRAPGPSPRPP